MYKVNTDIKFYITESLFKLLESNELNKIKITDIVKLSGISRTTFYNNFKNINEVIEYKFYLIVSDIFKLYKLNKLRNKNNNYLLKEIFNYIKNNKKLFIIIKNKFFFEFKNILDKYYINIIDNYKYYVISGIIINLCLYYIDNNFKINFNKIKID